MASGSLAGPTARSGTETPQVSAPTRSALVDGEDQVSTAAAAVTVAATSATCTITISGPATVLIGLPIHLQATASCDIGTPEVQWRHRFGTTTFSTFKTYSTSMTADFPTTGIAPGNHQFIARVRSQGTTTSFASNILTVAVSNAPAACTAIALDSPADGAYVATGTAVAMGATATCPPGTGPEYQYWAKRPGDASWTVLTGWVTGGASFTPAAGSWLVSAVARSIGSIDAFQVQSAAAGVTVSDAPRAVDDTLVVDEDTAGTVNVLANDLDPNGDPLTATITAGPAAGTATIIAGVVSYTPADDYHGDDAITYEVSDGTGNTATATLHITVSSINDHPSAQHDFLTVPEDGTGSIDVVANDFDVDGDPLTVIEITEPEHGTATRTGNVVTYVPAPDFAGDDRFEYTVSDPSGLTSTASVFITVVSGNHAPVAAADAASLDEDTGATIDVVANDSDVDGDALAIASITQPAHGTAVIVDATHVGYTPAANYHGPDAFSYAIADGHGGEATAAIALVVAPVNDAPLATGDAASLAEDTAATVDVVANDLDVDGDDLAITAITQPAHGLATVVDGHRVLYVPAPDYHGPDAFSYTISDGHGGQATAELALEVASVNDLPVAAADAASLFEDTEVTIDLVGNDSDADGDALAIAAITQPAHGSAAIVDAHHVSYAPAANYHGADSFSYTVDDGHGGQATEAVALDVISVNDAPVAVADAASLDEDTQVTVDVAGNDSDVDGDALAIASITQPAHGAATVADATHVTYTPAANYHGPDAFSYTISDGHGGTATATLAFTVASVNDVPVVSAGAASTFDDTPVAITLAASDADGDALALSITAGPAHGTLGAIAGNRVVYTPAAGYAGPDALTFAASDGQASASATVAITVVRSVCGNGIREGVHEECDDGNAAPADGCESTCKLTCGSGTGADRASVDPVTGHCFAAYDGVLHSYQEAAALCTGVGGHLPTVTSASEDIAAFAAVRAGDTPWLGGDDLAVEGTFGWITGEPFAGYANFAAGKPDNAGNADCLQYRPDGTWTDASCAATTGTLCELELAAGTPAVATGGAGTRAVAAADFNGDGYLDVAAANGSASSVGILLGNGAGGLALQATYATGAGPSAIAIADLDRDGHPDLAILNATAGTATILRGSASGAFTAAGTVTLAAGAAALAIADFDLDGNPDLAVAATGALQVLHGNGSGGFSPLATVPFTGTPASLAAGDFDRDGLVDLAVATTGAVLVARGITPGTFAVSVSLASTSNRGMVAADLDGDGNLDLAVASGTSSVAVWFGTAAGLSGTPTALTVASTPLAVAAGDFDGDGATDLAALTAGTTTLLRRTGRSFTQLGAPVATGGSGATAVIAANLDGDAAQDVIVASATSSTAGLLLGGPGGFAGARALPASTGAIAASATVSADFNGDGLADLAIVDPSASKVSVLLQTAAGAMVPSATITLVSGAQPTYVVAADFNLDGKLDLATANVGFSSVSVLLGTGTGTFGSPVNTGVGSVPSRIAVGDLNGDTKPDLVVPTSSDTVAILLGTTGGHFGHFSDLAAGSAPSAAVVADFNGDSKKDIAVSTTGEASVKLLIGHGDATFDAASAFAVASAGKALAAGDLDGDGKLDLIATGTATSSVSILHGTGTGSFAAAVTVAAGSQPAAVAAVDLDGDTRLDLVVGNAGSNDVTLLHADGAGGFAATRVWVGAPLSWVCVADLDHDGHLDVAASTGNPFVTTLFSAR
ncbi:MAG TPA: tandem-95 repeat protein [Kofleriaceae bacterium]|nr:tandem-95 repeat protein [Kofleriaceae bacterium]